MRYSLVLALIGFVHAVLPAEAQQAPDVEVAKEGPHDRALSGVFSPDRVNSDMEADARKGQDSGKAPWSRGRKYYFSVAATPTEFADLAKYTVFLLAVWTQKGEELPVKRMFIRADGQEVPIQRLSSWRTDVAPMSIAAKMFGPNREDGFYLVPTGMMLRSGQIIIDLSANRTGWVMLDLPSKVVTAVDPQRIPNPDPAPGAKPNLKTLQAFIQRKFAGFPVPQSVP
jgi:hypothetical protein